MAHMKKNKERRLVGRNFRDHENLNLNLSKFPKSSYRFD